MEGRTITHFKLLDKLGAGGMGVVYKARDLVLDRDVALKFLPAHLSADARVRARLLREARAAATLEHENICTIYEVGESKEGQLFIAMALYDGQTLRDKLCGDDERGVSLESEEAVRIAISVGRGLQTAHGKGITHRDIKPDNIMITSSGGVKILDFGLAKMVQAAQLTKEGAAVGTISYMSPEQARGESVDHRTDIWALGIVFYEMLYGRPPFAGVYDQAIIYSILNEDPKPVSQLVDGLSEAYNDVITRCLAKQAADRFADVVELINALEALVETDSSYSLHEALSMPEEISIAVLPFDDLSPGEDNEYLAGGLTEELITDLSKIEGLRVTSRGSTMTFKGASESVQDIGRRLSVKYLVGGSVRRVETAVRIHVQLMDVDSNTNVWSEKYKGTVDDVFDLQESVSRSVVNAMQIKLTPNDLDRIAARPIDSFAAYDCYLRARNEMWGLTTEEAFDEALAHLQNGLEIVGDNELLLAGFAYTYWQAVNVGVRPPSDLDEASRYVEKILTANPQSHHAYRIGGLVRVLKGDLQGAAKDLRRAFETDSNDPDTLMWLSILYASAGRVVEAAPLVDRLAKIDPLNPFMQGLPGFIHLIGGRFELALGPFGRMYEMAPDSPPIRFFYGHALAYAGHTNEAESALTALYKDCPDTLFGSMAEFFLLALKGEHDSAIEAVTTLVLEVAKSDFQYSWILACAFSMIEEYDRAMEWLENAVSRGFINFPYLAEHDPFLAPLRERERFKRLMEKVKEKWQAFEV